MKKPISIFLVFALHLSSFSLACAAQAADLSTEIEKIQTLERNVQFNKARQELDLLLAKNDSNASLLILSAGLYLKMGQKMLALIEYEKARKVNGKDPVILVELARLHLENFSSDAALSMARQAVTLDPFNIKGQEILILALMANTYYGEANTRMKELLTAKKNDPEVLHLAYLVNKSNDKLDVASEYLKRAIRLKPTERQWLLELADTYQLTNKPQDACKVIEDYLALEPDSVEGLKKLAYVLEHSLHDYAHAQTIYSKILSLDPLNVAAQAGISRLEVKQNDFSAKLKRSLQSFWAQLLLWFAASPKQEQLY
jgi:predicted Zn-dependent protease